MLHTLHSRASAALSGDAPVGDATLLERRAHHLAQIGERDEAAGLLVEAAAAHLADHALLSAEAVAQRALDLAAVANVRADASDALARILAVQGRWTEALALDTAADREHGEQAARRYRMATCAMDAAQT